METNLHVKELKIRKDDKEIYLSESEIRDLQTFLRQLKPSRNNIPLLLLPNPFTSEIFEFVSEEITKEQFQSLILERV